jgi:hypothetical protein
MLSSPNTCHTNIAPPVPQLHLLVTKFNKNNNKNRRKKEERGEGRIGDGSFRIR